MMADALFILNAYDGTRYTIMRYEGREAVPPTPVIGAQNDGGATHVAWPSAFRFPNGTVRIYASRFYSGTWRDIVYWEAADGLNFTWGGVALAMWPVEPYGIGPAQVYYDADDVVSPWKMVYLVRGPTGPGTRIDLADSSDGRVWQRRGQVFTASQPFEASGVAPTWVTKLIDGSWALFYEAYQTLTFVPAAVAASATSAGPFTNQRVIHQPNGIVHSVSGGRQFTTTAQVSGQARLNEPHVIRRMAGGGTQATVPTRQVGATLYFAEPLHADYLSSVELAHAFRNKISPSYAEQIADGTWRGHWTGYGHWPDTNLEYTVSVEAPSLDGPWSVTPGPVPFSPWNLATLWSAENPTPVMDVPGPPAPPPPSAGTILFDGAAVSAAAVLSNGNRTLSVTAGGFHGARASPALSGKVYLEVRADVLNLIVGAALNSSSLDAYVGSSAQSVGWQIATGSKVWYNGTWVAYGGAGDGVAGDILMLAIDVEQRKMWGGRNGVWHQSGDPGAGLNPMAMTLPMGTLYLQACSNAIGPAVTLKGEATYPVPAGFTLLVAV